MNAKEYLEVRSRMTRDCMIGCLNCPLSNEKNGKGLECPDLENTYPDIAVKIVEKWNEENPIITNKDKFKEIKDNILKTFNLSEYDFECDRYGTKLPCILCKKFHNCDECREFWNSEYKEEK